MCLFGFYKMQISSTESFWLYDNRDKDNCRQLYPDVFRFPTDFLLTLGFMWCSCLLTFAMSFPPQHGYMSLLYRSSSLSGYDIDCNFTTFVSAHLLIEWFRLYMYFIWEYFCRQILKSLLNRFWKILKKQVTVVNLDCCTRDVLEQLLMCCWHGGLAATANDV